MPVEWLPKARADLAALLAYIANDNPAAAYDIHAGIRGKVEQLGAHPHIGRPGRVAGTRELVVARTPYIVAYRVEPNAVLVLRVLHGARLWPKELEGRRSRRRKAARPPRRR